jgi:predicted GIY-YIG superfamily endonuclease
MDKPSFFYVYILQSFEHPDRFYSGFTENLKGRLAHHNQGSCPHTRKFRPWRIKTAVAFSCPLDASVAVRVSQYLHKLPGSLNG